MLSASLARIADKRFRCSSRSLIHNPTLVELGATSILVYFDSKECTQSNKIHWKFMKNSGKAKSMSKSTSNE